MGQVMDLGLTICMGCAALAEIADYAQVVIADEALHQTASINKPKHEPGWIAFGVAVGGGQRDA